MMNTPEEIQGESELLERERETKSRRSEEGGFYIGQTNMDDPLNGGVGLKYSYHNCFLSLHHCLSCFQAQFSVL